MRDQIKKSVERMAKEDCQDVAITFNLASTKKKDILRAALDDEAVAEYVLQY